MKKVLILEDEVNIRSFVVINLKRAGYDVIEAGTGMEALEQLNRYPDIGLARLITNWGSLSSRIDMRPATTTGTFSRR